MTEKEKKDKELIQRFHNEFGDVKVDQEPTDKDLDSIEDNYTEELFEDIDSVLEEILIENFYE